LICAENWIRVFDAATNPAALNDSSLADELGFE
jgi:hypothetical protein